MSMKMRGFRTTRKLGKQDDGNAKGGGVEVPDAREAACACARDSLATTGERRGTKRREQSPNFVRVRAKKKKERHCGWGRGYIDNASCCPFCFSF
jgi:hypothetical protein